ncbi:hypothetical protein [Haloarchaeobius sp. HRN-SO-5]|uniref:hypothetical protein n=1 Tax=Haloarchaeobius sp. HRN-SO-5 TaxID=3446118 RepID=UPI003EB9A690
MSDDGTKTSQLRFEDGRLVEADDDRRGSKTEYAAEPVEPGEEAGFSVEVKSGALEVNGRLRNVVESEGRLLEFGSRSDAEGYLNQGESPAVHGGRESDNRDTAAGTAQSGVSRSFAAWSNIPSHVRPCSFLIRLNRSCTSSSTTTWMFFAIQTHRIQTYISLRGTTTC